MHCRVVEAKVQPGKMAEVLEIAARQVEKVKKTKGFIFIQILQSEGEIMAVSSWRTEKDLRAYAESQLAQDMLNRLAPLLIGSPTVKYYEIKLVAEGDEGFFVPDEGGEGG